MLGPQFLEMMDYLIVLNTVPKGIERFKTWTITGLQLMSKNVNDYHD